MINRVVHGLTSHLVQGCGYSRKVLGLVAVGLAMELSRSSSAMSSLSNAGFTKDATKPDS